jgi:colicin import membrane protein
MTEKRSDKWISATLSVLVHGVIVALLVWGFLLYRSPPSPEPQLAIEATVVDSSTLPADVLQPAPQAAPVTEPTPPPPEPEPEPVQPEPTPPAPEPPPPDDSAQQAEQERKQRELEEQEKQRVEREEAQRVADARAQREKEERAAAEAERKRQETERLAREKVEREKAEQAARQKAAEERLRAQREAELRAQLAAEERVTAARSSGQMQQYLAQIQARIERAWIRPASARQGLSCEVRITQVPGGEVVGVQVQTCNGDDAVRQSIEAAAYRASPLPQPSDSALFDRNLVVTFRPEE